MEISANAFGAGIASIQTGQRRIDQAATQIADAALAPPQSQPQQARVDAVPASDTRAPADLEESLVALRVGQHEAQVGARLVKTADEVLGTLIDTQA
ncbi:hypothetical protein I0D00_20330 [Pseudomonas lalucatii]|uniref:Pyrroloquinoline quinone biosynthesis protein PqqE n=1 Tax=Pseudomonas lalucatii TaxID=1424203 RepID=A0ABS5Q646_9PSED|nr:hypothetical protein [Pseudomonas lalucatii]MBS7664260.1 hypothetical protein [Pseudomonas lalucatii]MBS7690954.1 hypothetical protein [Pseudomonas lalucatii]MBS7725519.1 hypothetical protein [Pseudomonas lalucatii]QVM86542.1 hypothetical protein I0D68_11590 [Pseudomonas lalucatii]